MVVLVLSLLSLWFLFVLSSFFSLLGSGIVFGVLSYVGSGMG